MLSAACQEYSISTMTMSLNKLTAPTCWDTSFSWNENGGFVFLIFVIDESRLKITQNCMIVFLRTMNKQIYVCRVSTLYSTLESKYSFSSKKYLFLNSYILVNLYSAKRCLIECAIECMYKWPVPVYKLGCRPRSTCHCTHLCLFSKCKLLSTLHMLPTK